METVIRAALAPANPSAQDLAVAAQARQVLNEVAQDAREERQNLDEPSQETGHANAFKANRAYQSGGAQDGQNFLAQQSREALFFNTEQSFNIVI